MKRIYFFLFALNLFASCQSGPTKIYDSQVVKSKDQKEQAANEFFKDEVILDARPNFDYSLSHINGSINVRWDEFTQKDAELRGVFERDIYFHARRLARMGIGPDTPVTVVGRGLQGAGEEGRLAWTLKYLGLKNVRFFHIDLFVRPKTLEEAKPKAAVAIWKPELDNSLIVSRSEFLQKSLIKKPDVVSPIIIDVRPTADYLGKTPSPFKIKPPDVGAINVPWTEFITSQGEANQQIKEKLLSVGVTPDKEIIAVSNYGIESATVTLVLRELGFAKSANLAGGYAELLHESQNKVKK